MSVFGGDSWGREAQFRKRRLEELVAEGIDASSFKKLSNGRYACLVCPNNPVLDSSLMLSMHSKGVRHCNSVSKLKEKELMRRNEINKRIALSSSPPAAAKFSTSNQSNKSAGKPLLEQTHKAIADVLQNGNTNGALSNDSARYCRNVDFVAQRPEKAFQESQLDFWEHREKELKFTASGWKRDCHGKWYKDENVEFDSDEEDPNICLG